MRRRLLFTAITTTVSNLDEIDPSKAIELNNLPSFSQMKKIESATISNR